MHDDVSNGLHMNDRPFFNGCNNVVSESGSVISVITVDSYPTATPSEFARVAALVCYSLISRLLDLAPQ